MVQDMSFIKLGDDAADFVEADIAILAGVVNFLPHPNSPRTRSLGSKKFTNDLGLLYQVLGTERIRYRIH